MKCDSKTHSRAGKFTKAGENLYRYTSNGVYYAVYRHKGKLKWKSLKTDDKPLAKRRLKEEIEKADRIDPNASRTTLQEILKLYEQGLQQYDQKTIQTRKSILKVFKETWPHDLASPLRDITTSQLEIWLGQHRQRLKKSTYNEYTRFLRHLFEVGVKSRVLADSPAAPLKELRREKPIRETPTAEQFQAIVNDVRNQKYNADAEDTADLIEFMGLAGAGTAEARHLLCEHVDLVKGVMRFYRHKTDTGFVVPIFPQVRCLLEKFAAAGRLKVGERVFRVADPKKALAAACVRLGYPKFSPRAVRRFFITRAVELGVDFKTIAAWQGHKDGGVLIAKTYSHLRNEHSDAMAQKLIALKPVARQPEVTKA